MADHYIADAEFLRAVIVGETDPLTPDAVARLTVLWSRYGGFDAGMGDLCRRAFEVRHAAAERAEEAEDRAYLDGMINGTVELLSAEVFPRIEPMFTKYAEGSDMYALLEKAATVFGDAVQEVAFWVLAGNALDRIRIDGPDLNK